MIVDTTVSFHEKRICMAQRLHAAVLRKRAKKHIREKNCNVIVKIDADAQKSFARLIDNIERLNIYLQKARANYCNQTVVVL